MTDALWSVGPAGSLSEDPRDGTIHLWTCLLDLPVAVLWHLGTVLGDEERLRGAGFASVQAALSFLARRIVARTIASWYMGRPAGDVRWVLGTTGKPALQEGLCDKELQFSWSQAGRMVAVAVSVSSPVGVDAVEKTSWRQLAVAPGVFCSIDEASRLRSLAPSRRASALVQCWAGKEACLKAAGIGLLGDPRSVETWGNDRPRDRAVLRDTQRPPGLSMTVKHVLLDEGVHVAVACAIPELHLVRRTLAWCGEGAL
jgi:phosphopantetheinyl transferase